MKWYGSDQYSIWSCASASEAASLFQHANPQLKVIGFSSYLANRWQGPRTYDRCQNTDDKLNGSQFLAEMWLGLPSQALKTAFLKLVFSSYWSQVPGTWDNDGYGWLVMKLNLENRLSERVAALSTRLWLSVVQIWTSGQLTLVWLGSTQSPLLVIATVASCLRRFNLNKVKGSTEYQINDLECEGDYMEMARRK